MLLTSHSFTRTASLVSRVFHIPTSKGARRVFLLSLPLGWEIKDPRIEVAVLLGLSSRFDLLVQQVAKLVRHSC